MKFYYFILFYERAWVGEGQRERERERIPSRSGAQRQVWPHDHEIMTWVDIRSLMLNRLRQPGAPVVIFYRESSANSLQKHVYFLDLLHFHIHSKFQGNKIGIFIKIILNLDIFYWILSLDRMLVELTSN